MSAPTKRQLAGNQRRTLKAMRERLIAMGQKWDDLDNFAVVAFGELAERVEALAIDLFDDEYFEDLS